MSKRLDRLIDMLAAGRFDYLRYAAWVRLKGLDFGTVSLAELGFSSGRSVHHSASGGAYLAEALRKTEIPRGSRILDLGSGKGSAACTLASFPFEEVLGIELSEPLKGIAEANVRRLGLKKVHFLCCDAGRFTDFDRFTHLYMFNPFPEPVVLEVLGNLRASLERVPRDFTVIYHYPVCGEALTNSGLFRKEKELEFPSSHPFFIYTHPGAGT